MRKKFLFLGLLSTAVCTYAQSTDFPVNNWKSGWFINAAAGAGAFVGQPLGCEDLFGRSQPMFHLSAGKWFNPSAGGRIAFQGFNLKNHLIERQDYYHIHADFLLNATNLFRQSHSPAFWQVIPFAGAGIIQNNTTHKHPFSLNYGILNQLRLSKSLSLSFELGGLTTFGDFDGAGRANKFADHLFHLSAGFTITLGQKERSYSSAPRVHPDNRFTTQNNTSPKSTPNNNYSGLNSLRERLSGSPSGETTASDTLSSLIGTPILFFFRVGTSKLTDTSQLANLDAIATVCRKFNLLPSVIGYADSATGNATGNSVLSEERARYITNELIQRGIEEKSITSKGEGGIATYSPNEVNRCVKVEIYQKSDAEK